MGVDRVLRVLGQMRTAVILLAVCALASMTGTLLVQGLPIQDYVVKFGPFWARVFWHAGLTDVFRAWWFVGILGVLLTSVSVCLLRNGPGIWRQAWKRRAAVGRRINRLGYFCVHVGVLGVAVAGLVTGLVGWRGTLNLREGETDRVVLVWRGQKAEPHFLPMDVTNKGFEIEQYPSGMPSRYATTLGFGASERVVEVNKPVREGAYTFYQASFGDGGSAIRGEGINLRSGAVVPFEGHVYDKAMLADGTRVEILDFRPFTVETMAGERPTDVGPSVDYLVQPPDAAAVQLRAYLNHPEILGVADGQKAGGAGAGAVVYRPVNIGLSDYRMSGLSEEVFWGMVAKVAAGADFKNVVGPVLGKVGDEKARIAAGLGVMQAARVVRELGLTHLIVLTDFTLRRYSGLQVAHDPGAGLFWLFAGVLLVGVVGMLVARK